MSDYNLVTNFTEIIAGTNNTITPSYQEAANTLETSNNKTMGYIKNFMTSIESIASKSGAKDSRISDSKGNISQFSGYKDITGAIEFLEKNISGVPLLGDLKAIKSALESMKDQYMDGYSKQIRLIMLEYESALYLLVTGLVTTIVNHVDVVQKDTELKISKKSASDHGVITKSIQEMTKQLATKNHKEYLSELLSAKENTKINTDIKECTIVESSISDTIDLIDSITNGISKIGRTGKMIFMRIKNSLFGIIPLIRSALYLKYKKKADTVLALEQQMQFIEMNIDQLKNIKNMDPAHKEEIIKKQQAVAEAYRKKAEKLRAQLLETEKDASDAIKSDDKNVQKDSSDEFILESHSFISLTEAADITTLKATKTIKDAAVSMVDDLIEGKWSNLELRATVGDTSRSIEFFVDIKGERKQCHELADNKIIDAKEMEKEFDIFARQIKKLADYVKGNVNKLSIKFNADGDKPDKNESNKK